MSNLRDLTGSSLLHTITKLNLNFVHPFCYQLEKDTRFYLRAVKLVDVHGVLQKKEFGTQNLKKKGNKTLGLLV